MLEEVPYSAFAGDGLCVMGRAIVVRDSAAACRNSFLDFDSSLVIARFSSWQSAGFALVFLGDDA